MNRLPAAATAALVAVATVLPAGSAGASAAARDRVVTGMRVAVAAATPQACHPGAGVRAAQVIVVRSHGATASVKACRRTSTGHYVVALGPYSGHVGRNGVAPKGAKREGDGRTPSGVFHLRSGFGVHADPGVRFAWRHVDSRDVWVDDVHSRYYNLHERTPVRGRWTSAEHLKVSPSYDYAQVIGYNEARVRGRGSAIFFHVDHGGGTAGCVSVPRAKLLKLLRWERAGAVISIARAKAAATTAVVPASVAVTHRAPFSSSVRGATRTELGRSWHHGCPVAVSRLRVVTLKYHGFDRRDHTGHLVVNASVVHDVRHAFHRLYAIKYPIRRMVPVSAYGGSDNRSMAADNTSAFNCRKAVGDGPASWSNHAYGVAIDLDPVENPYVLNGKALPPAGRRYVDRTVAHRGLIRAHGRVVTLFRSMGWVWGGVWSDPDYQHMQHPR